uniref:Uncharacterized protein n=1 Tax=Chromera velia CCMP2878 TaxID=1169474 RepID=A0A0G4GPE2_9ALVE|mmetsp:Transcript_53080/g.103859  ORF Transcript_53080/g.103859 Transcript_53080/m.103859 type:complete len:490 (+) Transcript_53080:182-1651(+)|eukprot:Cvel_22798.t1-p1 / transcript=Cvel_22798.t1 / gene=Cvel_22798 / organism=Chromera_velia_CCMP2878 / gene_product=hypothetical protein / transcript_product=hypothetical protein / location=Cvel_scaffold2281:10144-14181(+) / protein_length=489 / sequence_SO=supercontig / SO=protein_coding / is_pseudo=false
MDHTEDVMQPPGFSMPPETEDALPLHADMHDNPPPPPVPGPADLAFGDTDADLAMQMPPISPSGPRSSKQRKRLICEHGRRKNTCKECGGAAVCAHGRQRYYCKDCGGNGICMHLKKRTMCKECGGSGICIHGKHRTACKECVGQCMHGNIRTRCKKCVPYTGPRKRGRPSKDAPHPSFLVGPALSAAASSAMPVEGGMGGLQMPPQQGEEAPGMRAAAERPSKRSRKGTREDKKMQGRSLRGVHADPDPGGMRPEDEKPPMEEHEGRQEYCVGTEDLGVDPADGPPMASSAPSSLDLSHASHSHSHSHQQHQHQHQHVHTEGDIDRHSLALLERELADCRNELEMERNRRELAERELAALKEIHHQLGLAPPPPPMEVPLHHHPHHHHHHHHRAGHSSLSMHAHGHGHGPPLLSHHDGPHVHGGGAPESPHPHPHAHPHAHGGDHGAAAAVGVGGLHGGGGGVHLGPGLGPPGPPHGPVPFLPPTGGP